MPERYVLDTDIVSYLFRGDSRGDPYHALLDDAIGVISFMTLAEVEYWAIVRRWGPSRRRQLEEHLAQFVVVFANAELCRIWARVVAQDRANGRPILPSDAWIAATAINLDVPLITNNLGDYAGVTELRLASVPKDDADHDV